MKWEGFQGEKREKMCVTELVEGITQAAGLTLFQQSR